MMEDALDSQCIVEEATDQETASPCLRMKCVGVEDDKYEKGFSLPQGVDIAVTGSVACEGRLTRSNSLEIVPRIERTVFKPNNERALHKPNNERSLHKPINERSVLVPNSDRDIMEISQETSLTAVDMEGVVFDPNSTSLENALTQIKEDGLELYNNSELNGSRQVRMIVKVKKSKLKSITTSTMDDDIVVVFELIV